MEIKLANISIKDKNKYLINNLNLTFKSNEITGIYHGNYLINLLYKNKEYNGNILIDGRVINSYIKRKFSYIEINPNFLTNKVSDEFYLIKKDLKDSKEKYIEKIESSLNMVGLPKEYLDRKINTLSKSEKKLIQIALKLIINPELIILENPFNCLDGKSKMRIKKLIKELVKEYNKNILLFDDNINNLYELSNSMVIFKENELVISGKSNVVFSDLKFLIDKEIDIPDILKFINDSKEYGIKLSNTCDIKELIKDVKRNVKESNK